MYNRRSYKNIPYILQFLDSARLIASSLSNLVNNLSEEIHRIKCKYGDDDKKCKINAYCDRFFECASFKDDLIGYKYLCWNK